MKTRLLALLAVAVLPTGLVGACHIDLLSDLEVGWSYNGVRDTSICSTYGIARWRVEINGPEPYTFEGACTGPWDTGVVFYSIIEGGYNVTVMALDSADQLITSKQRLGVEVIGAIGPRVNLDFTEVDFTSPSVCGDTKCTGTETCTSCPGDCGACTTGQVNIYWNINGTVDGTPKGLSWDTCAEVNATHAVVTVDGVESKHDCHASGKMSTSVSVDALPSVQVKLVDSTGTAITTLSPASPGPTLVAGNTDVWEYVAEFFYDSFTPKYNGDFLFTTTYEGKSCSATSPPVQNQTALVKLNGTPVTVDVCGPDSACVNADGVTPGKCYTADSTNPQYLSTIEWGEYQMKLQGGVGTTPNVEICWEKEFDKTDILIGAGSVNPVRALDLPRVSTSANCQ